MRKKLKSTVKLDKCKLNKRYRYSQESIDVFAQDHIREMPFMSKYIKVNYQKYLMNKYRDKLCNIRKFLNADNSLTPTQILAKDFEKLNFITIKIALLERDIKAYRIALASGFDSADDNRLLQETIYHKYGKLRKFDCYRNLTLAEIYDKCFLQQKIASFGRKAEKQSAKLKEKYNSPAMLIHLQKEYMLDLIFDKGKELGIFEEDVPLGKLRSILAHNPTYSQSLLNLDTFTYDYIYSNRGVLSKSFVSFQSKHKNSTINVLVRDFLQLLADELGLSNSELNEIQDDLLHEFKSNFIKQSNIFSSMESLLNTNDIILRAKTNFVKAELIRELEYCLDMPEINNYYNIINNRDSIPHYNFSKEKIFVERIEKEFPEIKSESFVYLYNELQDKLETYRDEIASSETYLVADFINSVYYNEFYDDMSEDELQNVLSEISVNIFTNPIAIKAKKNLDMYCKVLMQFTFHKLQHQIYYANKLSQSRLFHQILISSNGKPILPIEVQRKISHLPLDAQRNLANDYFHNTLLDFLDDCAVDNYGDLYINGTAFVGNNISNEALHNLAMNLENGMLKSFAEANADDPTLVEELKLTEYIIAGSKEDIAEYTFANTNFVNIDKDENNVEKNKQLIESVSTEDIERVKHISKNVIQNDKIPEENANNSEINKANVSENTKLDSYNVAKEYLTTPKDTSAEIQKNKVLRIQKRINSGMLLLDEVQINNINQSLDGYNLSLRTPNDYIYHLIDTYKEKNRDLSSLEIGLKLRVRTGNLKLTDQEIDKINEDNNFNIIQKSSLKIARPKAVLADTYHSDIPTPSDVKDKITNVDAFVARKIYKKNAKLIAFDYRLHQLMLKKNLC